MGQSRSHLSAHCDRLGERQFDRAFRFPEQDFVRSRLRIETKRREAIRQAKSMRR